jgi:hypothetical protein
MLDPLSRRQWLVSAVLAGGLGISRRARLSAAWRAQAEGAVDVPWLNDVQQPPRTPLADPPKLSDLLHPSGQPAVETLDVWRRERARLRGEWLEFLGPMPAKRPPVKLTTVSEDHPEGVTRRLVRYEGEPGITVEGYLLIPDRDLPGADERGRRAGLVALHPTTNDTIHEIAGVRGPEEHHVGLRLARRGFVVFCPLCFLWHDCRDIPDAVRKFHDRRPGTKGMAKMLYDAQRGVDVLESLTELVDPARLGAVGHSLGAKETLYLQAFDDRVRAGVFSEGGIGFPSTNWNAPWYLGPAIQEDNFPLNHHQLLALIAPRPFLVLGGETGPGAADGDRSWPYLEAALPVWKLFDGPPRLGLLNHGEGHRISAASFDKLAEWLTTYLACTGC